MAIIRDYIDGQFGNDETEEVGIGGFVTFARVSERFTRTAEVPTTFLEDGSHINDHIIRNPLTLSIEGNVSDVFLRPSPAIEAVRRAQVEVGNITQFAPARTQSQVSKISGIVNDVTSAIDQVDAIIDAGQQAAGFLGLIDSEARSNQEAFIDTIESIYESESLIAIDMPFRTYERMAITSIEVTRDNQQKALSFSIEATQFRFAQTIFTQGPAPNPASGTNGQTDGETDKGVQEGAEPDQSFANYLLGIF